MTGIAKVILPTALDKEFDYSFSESQAVEKGMRVEVDFRGRKSLGLVVSLARQSKIKKLKNISGILDAQPLLDNQQFSFAEALSRYYPYSLGEFLFMMLPPYLKKLHPCGSQDRRRPNQKCNLPSTKFIKANDVMERYRQWRSLVNEKLKSGSVLICLPQSSYLLKVRDLLERDFPRRVKALHSHQTEKEFFQNWCQSRQNSLIIGMRMALFYYPADLNLMIIEEEDSQHYFQEEKPFYHLREAAGLLSKNMGIDLVLAGNNPSLVTYQRICDNQIKLIEGVEETKKINLIDLGGSLRKKIVGPVLIELLGKTLGSGKTAVVLWNKKDNPKSLGLGIKGLAARLKLQFPEARIDSWEKRSLNSRIVLATVEILSSLYDREVFDAGFLLDTDAMLGRPDYQVTFDTYLYIKKLGSFFREPLSVFTVNPQYYLFEYLNQDWRQYYQKELNLRKKMELPPCKLLVKISLRSKNEKPLLKYAQDLYNNLKADFAEIYGPSPDHPFKLRDKYRYLITIKTEGSPQQNRKFTEKIARARRGNLQLAVQLH
ncbi:MAG: hypothetical protein KJ619_05265 [Candidatus Omnitrophica bacterium]|nr:hypothetical protein [Candidatus Omnitrophota bacterium]MBU2250971.1 hypothetical protein [Candidatus Omnitrophota bacterium]